MKKSTFIILLSAFFFVQNMYAQKGKITDAQLSLQAGKVLDAKKSIDEALQSEEIQKRSDAWNTKGDVNKNIYESKIYYAQNPNCLFDAKEAYIKAFELETNPKKQKNVYPNLDLVYGYLFNEGFERFNGKKYDDAYKYFKASVDVNDFLVSKGYKQTIDTNAVFAAGISAANDNKLEEALPILKRLEAMNYDNVAVYETLAQIYDNTNQKEELAKLLKTASAKYPNNKNFQVYELNASLDAGDVSASLKKFEAAAAKDPDNPTIQFNLAALYDKAKQTDKAIETYQKVIKANPKFGDAYFNIGVIYFNQGVEVNKKMNAIDDKDDPLGEKFNAMKKERNDIFNKALPYLEKAYEIDPKNADYKQNLKKVYASMNMLDKAKALGE